MNPLLIEVAAAVAVGLFAVFLVLQPMLSPEPDTMPPTTPLDELIDPEETPEGTAVSALREIEFDRATGKLSDEDYAFLKSKYTALAVQALRVADGGTAGMAPRAFSSDARAAVERLVAGRLAAMGSTRAQICGRCGPAAEPDADFCSRCGDALGSAYCRTCGTVHLAGGRYCEQCGARHAAP